MFRRNHPNKLFAHRAARGVVRAAHTGRETLIREALLELQMEPGAERFGVWLDSPARDDISSARRVLFRGEVRERGAGLENGPISRWNFLCPWIFFRLGKPLS